MKLTDKLSPHFTFGEMIASQTAARNSLDNTPSDKQTENLKALCENVLEPIRIHYKKPVIIQAGYRCPEVNKLVGGAERSQHMQGEAADIDVFAIETIKLFEWIVLESDIIWDQIIHEFGEWAHISYKRVATNRGKITTAKKVDGKTVYTNFTKERIAKGDYL